MSARSGVLRNLRHFILVPTTSLLFSGCTGPQVTTSPSPSEFVYVTHEGYSIGNSPTQYLISQYSIAASGQLTPLDPQTLNAQFEVNEVAVDPAGGYAYFGDNEAVPGYCVTGLNNVPNDMIVKYGVNSNGTLTAGTATVPSGCTVAIGPSGKYVYIGSPRAVDGTSQIAEYMIQPDGSLQAAGSISVTGNTYLIFNSNESYAYTADGWPGTVSQFSVGQGGVLSPLSPASVQSGADSVSQPDALVIHPSNRFVYSANWGDNTISQFSVNTDGTLQALSPANVTTVTCPDSIVIDPSGKFLYAAPCVDGPVGQFSIGSDGKLTPLSPATVSAGGGAHTLAIDPSGQYLYVTNATDGTISQFSIGGTGALFPLSPATIADSPAPDGVLAFAILK